jgi:hypothetical protein
MYRCRHGKRTAEYSRAIAVRRTTQGLRCSAARQSAGTSAQGRAKAVAKRRRQFIRDCGYGSGTKQDCHCLGRNRTSQVTADTGAADRLTEKLSRPPDEYRGVSRHERSAHPMVENRSERAVGCSEGWAGRPGWQLLGRHTSAAMTLAARSTRPSTARVNRGEP